MCLFIQCVVTVCFIICSKENQGQQIIYPNVKVETKTAVKMVSVFGNNDSFRSSPEDVRYNKYDKRVYVADTEKHRIVVFDEELNYITTFGRLGQGPGEFRRPSGIAFMSDGRIVIADWGNSRYQIFDKNYQFINMFSVSSPLPTLSYYPGIDSKDRIYVNMPGNGSLFSVYDDKGSEIKSGGELMPIPIDSSKNKQNWKLWYFFDSAVHYDIDETGKIYCAFINYPVLRILSPEFNVIREADLSKLSTAVDRLKYWERFMKKDTGYQPKLYVKDVSLDSNYFYAMLYGDAKAFIEGNIKQQMETFKLYAFSKDELHLEKEIMLELKDESSKDRFSPALHFDFSHEKNIYAIYFQKGIILFRK